MKYVDIIGVGMGADTLTAEAACALAQADLWLGAGSVLAQFAPADKPWQSGYTPQAVAAAIEECPATRFAVLVSGDSGFFSAAAGISAALADDMRYTLRVLPGISSLSYLFSRLCRPWQEVAVISQHGRQGNLVDTVRRNRLTFVLSGNLAVEGAALAAAGFGGLQVWLGEELGRPGERILVTTAAALAASGGGGQAVFVVENPDFDSRTRVGITDSAFQRSHVPMTKAEIRAVVMSKLALAPQAICADIGAGSGAVTVEMALAAYAGHVYAVDQDPEAIRLVEANCRAFHLGNVEAVLGSAPAALADLPPLDAAFIGGSSGALPAIFSLLRSRQPRLRLVVTAVTLETLTAAQAAFAEQGIVAEIVQISVARAEAAGSLHMLRPLSPVFILSGGGDE